MTDVSEAQVSNHGSCNSHENQALCVSTSQQQRCRAGLTPPVPISQMSPLRPREATMGLTQDLTGSKGLRTCSGAPVLGINTQDEFCSPVATSCDILGHVLNVQP